MLFTIIALVVVAALVVYATKKKKSSVSTPVHVEETIVAPSIHEEITKTVEEAKNLAPVVDEVSKPKKPKKPIKVETPTKVETPAPTMSAKKKVAPKAKK
jgi:hypothetical protein